MTDITDGDPAAVSKLAIGRIDVIENKDRREGEPDRWLRVYLMPEGSDKKIQAFFTAEETLQAIARVAENREDVAEAKAPPSVMGSIKEAINGLFDRLG